MGASMGDLSDGPVRQPASRVLELCISAPQLLDIPKGGSGRSARLMAKVGLAAHGRDAASEVPWDQPVPFQLPSDRAALLISLYSLESSENGGKSAKLLTDVCLPAYAGPGGLQELGVHAEKPPRNLRLALKVGDYYVAGTPLEDVAAALQQARDRYRSDKPSLTLSLREMAGPAAADVAPADLGRSVANLSAEIPQSKRQVITLELQNAQLANKLRSAGIAVPQGSAIPPLPTHVRELTELQKENEQLRQEREEMTNRLNFLKQTLAEKPQPGEKKPAGGNGVPGTDGNDPDGNRDWGRTLRVMEQELAHSLERRRKIQANFEERVRTLQEQLQDAMQQQAEGKVLGTGLDPEVLDMREKIEDAMRRRDDLMKQWREAREAGQRKNGDTPSWHGYQSANPDIQRLLAKSQHYKAEIHALKQELALRKEQEQGSQRQQQLKGNISQLYEELDELQRVREDERVRGESEVRELKIERDLARDRLADATAELQRLRAKKEAMQSLQAEEPADSAALEPLRAEHAQLVAEMGRLRQLEEARKQTIQDLEREQEALVEKTSLITLQAMPYKNEGSPAGPSQENDQIRSLEAKVAELQKLVISKQQDCHQLETSVASLQDQAQQAASRSQALRGDYEALQQRADERLLRNPEPARR